MPQHNVPDRVDQLAGGGFAARASGKAATAAFSARCPLRSSTPRGAFATPCRCCGHGSVSEASAAPSADKTAGQIAPQADPSARCKAPRHHNGHPAAAVPAAFRRCKSRCSQWRFPAPANNASGHAVLSDHSLQGRLAVGLFAHCSRHAPPFSPTSPAAVRSVTTSRQSSG